MFRHLLLCLLSCMFLVDLAAAQSGSLISQVDANRFGMKRMWFSRVSVDSARGRVVHINQHVSSTKAYTVFEVTYDGGKTRFSERDLDQYGNRLGKEQAEKLANRLADDLKRFNAQVTVQTIPRITIFTMTDQGVAQAIDSETGETRWITEVGNPLHPSEAIGASDDFVAVVNGSNLYVLNEDDGKIVWHRKTKGAPGAGPALSHRYAFVPMVNGAVEAYQLENSAQPPWIFRSIGRALVQPIYTGANVAWPTDRGHLYVAEGNRNNILYRIETNDAIVAPAARLSPSRLLTASTDGYVYCMHELSGNILWRFSTGEPISQSPIVIGEGIYVITDDDSMFRISAETGREVWWTGRVSSMVSASDSRLYCRDSSGTLSIINADTGSRIGSIATQQLDLQLFNFQTDRIIIGTRTGLVQCLREIQHEWPLIHVSAIEPPDETQAREKKPEGDEAEAAPTEPDDTPGAEDPFGEGDADPFGGGGDAGGSEDAGMEDPFGF